MKNTKTTKRALFASVMAMLLCVAMLVGTTFAWFTDSTSTGVNKIQAGTLELGLEMKNVDGEWVNAEGQTLTWQKAQGAENETVLWEPGCTYKLPTLKITNKGNLALQFKILINNISGNLKLLDALEFTVEYFNEDPDSEPVSLPVDINESTSMPFELPNPMASDPYYEEYIREFGWTGIILDTAEYIENNFGTDHICVKISAHMKEEAGNEYQGLALNNMAITVVAAQAAGPEHDSNGNTYDKDATYPVSNSAALVAAIADAETGSVVTLTPGNFLLSAGQQIGEGVTIAGNGPSTTTITTSTTPSGANKTGLVIDNSNVTIKDVKINGSVAITSNEYCGVIDIREGGTTLDNVSISRSFSNASCVVIKNGVDSGETVTLKNSTFKGGFKTIDIVDGANGNVVIDNCEITGVYTFNVNSASSQDLTIKVTDSKLHGWTSYGRIKEAIFENTEFSKGTSAYDYLRPYADTTLTDCTFDADLLIGAGTTGFTITLNNCVKNGVAVTADNIQSLVLDADDIDNLRGCTIIVNGVTVTLS